MRPSLLRSSLLDRLSVGRSVGRPVSRSVGRWVGRSVGPSVDTALRRIDEVINLISAKCARINLRPIMPSSSRTGVGTVAIVVVVFIVVVVVVVVVVDSVFVC